MPLDAWVIERESLDPLAYAELWIRDGGTVPGDPEFARLAQAWLDDFAERDVTAIGFGYILLRRPARVRRRSRATSGSVRPAAARTSGATSPTHSRCTIASRCSTTGGSRHPFFRVAPDVTEARHHMPGEDAPSVIELRQGGGLGRTIGVDPALAALVGACDGDLADRRAVGRDRRS